jgi:hypothetical protein
MNSAVLSPCGTYRYRLDREIGTGDQTIAFIGVNPSTADATADDATVRKWRGFATRLGTKRFIVGNVFGYRATDVNELKEVVDPFGPEWADHIQEILSEADLIVPCWGSRLKLPRMLYSALDTMNVILAMTEKPLLCWGTTGSGDPIHPLMLAYSTPLIPYNPK